MKVRDSKTFWSLLRKPFPLCECLKCDHECEWEIFDFGKAGCLLCGAIHECSAQTCKNREEVSDGVVCTVTGCYIEEKNYVQPEFSDNVIACGENPAQKTNDSDNVVHDCVSLHVQNFLTSENSRLVYHYETIKLCQKLGAISQNTIMECVKNDQVVNLVDVIASATHEAKQGSLTMHSYDLELREAVATRCISYIVNLIIIWNMCSAKKIRKSELKSITIGILYLMRCGVNYNGVIILPKIVELTHILPSENLLMPFFGFKSKFITDTENRFKFLIKSMPPAKLKVLGFQNICH